MTTRAAPLVVGLLGGIGSGKSVVASEFARRGARIIRADDLGHAALQEPAIRDQVVTQLGRQVLDDKGEIDRARVASIVFEDRQARKELERIVHPWIRQRAEKQIDEAKREGVQLVIVDAAVLLEAGWGELCDQLVFVETPEEVRQSRVTQSRGWSIDHWKDREAAQLPLTEKHARADHVLDNSSTLEHLSRQVENLMRLWGLAPAGAPTVRGPAPK